MAREAKPKRSAARITCASCGAALRTTHKFCPNCGTPVGATAAPAAAAAPAPAAAPGPSLQVGAQTGDALEEQRKVVSVMFADISGSTPLTERLDPEEMRGVLASYFNALAHEIRRFGGTIDKYIGDAVMAVFGAPVSHEDDAERAVGAGMAMQGAIARENDNLERRYGVRLSLRIGINTGEVVAGLLAGEVQGAYTVVGDTVNTAQRLESVAQPDTVLVGEATYRLARRSFYFETLAPVTLKGKAEPVPAYRLLARERRAAPREGSPLVGREAEMARLQEIFADASEGRGRIVHLSGEAGVGKSRLLNEFLSRLPEATVRVRARCTSYETATPYAFVADLVRRHFHIQRGEDEARADEALAAGLRPLALPLEEGARALFLELLGYGDRSALDPQRKAQLIATVLRLYLAHQAAENTLVVTAEDVHWIDTASASVLTHVVDEVARLRCLFLATSRDPAPVFPAAVPLPVAALDSEAAAAMVERAAGRALDPAVRALVLERTGGNPFFIEEVARALATNQAAAVPTSVQDLLEARLDALEQSARRVVRRAAVIGRSFWERVLTRISPGEPVQLALATLQAAAFVIPLSMPERMYQFRHALLQEVAYQTQLIAQRRRIHKAVGDAISQLFADRLEEFTDLLAYHYARSDDDAKAREYLLRAAQRAQRLFAKDEALAYYRSALERSGDDAAARSVALEGIGDVQRLAAAYPDALASYEQALAARPAGELLDRSRLLRKIGVIHLLRGEPAPALELFERAAAELPAGPSGERARALLGMGEVSWRQGRYDEAIARLGRAVDEAERAGDESALAEALKQLGTVHVMKGLKAEALRYYEQSLALSVRLGDVIGQANVLNNMGLVMQRQGRNADALAVHERALAIRERVGDQMAIAQSRNNAAEVYRAQGELDRAATEYAAALATWQVIGYAGVALARSSLGITEVEKGNYMTAREHLLQAVRELEQAGNRSYLLDTERHLARAFLPDDPAAALEWAERALTAARELRSSDKEGLALQVLGLVRAARGEREEAMAALERSLEILRATEERHELGRTLAALGRLYRALPLDDPRHAKADALLAEARGIFSDLGAALELRRLEDVTAARA